MEKIIELPKKAEEKSKMIVLVAKQIGGYRCFIMDHMYQYTEDTQKFLKEESYDIWVCEVENNKQTFRLFVDITNNNKLMAHLEDNSVINTNIIKIMTRYYK